jgi:hypothetical protein
MTRETKLGLGVGISFLILVGVVTYSALNKTEEPPPPLPDMPKSVSEIKPPTDPSGFQPTMSPTSGAFDQPGVVAGGHVGNANPGQVASAPGGPPLPDGPPTSQILGPATPGGPPLPGGPPTSQNLGLGTPGGPPLPGGPPASQNLGPGAPGGPPLPGGPPASQNLALQNLGLGAPGGLPLPGGPPASQNLGPGAPGGPPLPGGPPASQNLGPAAPGSQPLPGVQPGNVDPKSQPIAVGQLGGHPPDPLPPVPGAPLPPVAGGQPPASIPGSFTDIQDPKQGFLPPVLPTNPDDPAFVGPPKPPSGFGGPSNVTPVHQLIEPTSPAVGVGTQPPTTGTKSSVYDVRGATFKKEDGNLEEISKREYNTGKYAQALLQYNRDHPGGDAAFKASQPMLTPGSTVIFIPPVHVLEDHYPNLIGNVRPVPGVQGPTPPLQGQEMIVKPLVPVAGRQDSGTVVPVVTVPVTSGPGPAGPGVAVPQSPAPAPSGSVPPAGNTGGAMTKPYWVPQGGQHFYVIARQTLGDSGRWSEIWRLNPQIADPNQLVPAGTVLRLPAEARIAQ